MYVRKSWHIVRESQSKTGCTGICLLVHAVTILQALCWPHVKSCGSVEHQLQRIVAFEHPPSRPYPNSGASWPSYARRTNCANCAAGRTSRPLRPGCPRRAAVGPPEDCVICEPHRFV